MKLETLDSREEVESELESMRKEYDERTPEFWVALYNAVWLFVRAEKEKELTVAESQMNGSRSNQSLDSTLRELRQKGWRVAAHYEFELNNQMRTYWLFAHPCNRLIEAQGDVSREVLVLQLALGDATNHHCEEGT